MLEGFADIVEPMGTLLVSAEKRYKTKKSRSSGMRPQPRERLRSPNTTTKKRTLKGM